MFVLKPELEGVGFADENCRFSRSIPESITLTFDAQLSLESQSPTFRAKPFAYTYLELTLRQNSHQTAHDFLKFLPLRLETWISVKSPLKFVSDFATEFYHCSLYEAAYLHWDDVLKIF